MTYLLDTSTAVAAVRGQPAVVRSRLRDAIAQASPVAINSIAIHELWYGVARSARPDRNGQALRAFLSGIDVIDFDHEDAVAAGRLRSVLAARGEMIGPYDVLIAASAARRRLILVTSNVREFDRVPDLPVQDWSQPSAPER